MISSDAFWQGGGVPSFSPTRLMMSSRLSHICLWPRKRWPLVSSFFLCVCGSINSLCACQLLQALVYGKYLLNSSFYSEEACVPGALPVCWLMWVPLPPLGAEHDRAGPCLSFSLILLPFSLSSLALCFCSSALLLNFCPWVPLSSWPCCCGNWSLGSSQARVSFSLYPFRFSCKVSSCCIVSSEGLAKWVLMLFDRSFI